MQQCKISMKWIFPNSVMYGKLRNVVLILFFFFLFIFFVFSGKFCTPVEPLFRSNGYNERNFSHFPLPNRVRSTNEHCQRCTGKKKVNENRAVLAQWTHTHDMMKKKMKQIIMYARGLVFLSIFICVIKWFYHTIASFPMAYCKL